MTLEEKILEARREGREEELAETLAEIDGRIAELQQVRNQENLTTSDVVVFIMSQPDFHDYSAAPKCDWKFRIEF